MPYKKVASSAAPKRPRRGVSRFERTPEWKLMKADLDKGFKTDEALQLSVSEKDKEKYRIRHRRTIARFIRKYITMNNLPYILKSFTQDQQDWFIVQNARR